MPGLMSPERWKALERLLDAALDRDPTERSAFLDQVSGSDAGLRDELERTIGACEHGKEFLTRPAAEAFAALLADPLVSAPESLGRYRVLCELGRGGMATVYLADDPKHGRQVAVKVLHSEVARLVGRERFLREIEIAARLSHPHILPLHDSVELPDEKAGGGASGPLYYVTPYVVGESLRDRLRREGHLSTEEAVRLIGEIASALDYAHRQGVVHCDIKPENILLQEGHAVVADFGIARAISSVAGAAAGAGLPFGTPAYMSPEQAAGSPDLDGRSDIFSLGCMLHEMLTGERRATSTWLEGSGDPVRPTEPRPRRPASTLVAVIARATAFSRDDRFATAGDLARALESARSRATPLHRMAVLAAITGSLVGALYLGDRATGGSELDANLIAVAPFEVMDPALALWREGLVDVLARNLDGAGPLQTVPPTVVVRRWRGRADAASARELGERTGARLVLYGGLLSEGDSVRATAVLLDTETGRPFAELERRELASRIDRLTDSLTMAVLRELGRTRRIAAARASFSPTRSLAALKAYLQGEQLYRRAEWDSAQTHFEQALVQDSAFAMAYHRLAGVLEWRGTSEFGDSATSDLLQRASRFRRGLGPRDSLLVLIDSLRGGADILLRQRARTPSEPLEHEAAVRRLLGTMAEGTRRYPRDPEFWLLYADGRMLHEQWATKGEIDDRAILALYDRAIALDSAFAPAYLTPIQLSAHLDGADGARRYMKSYLAAGPRGEEARLIALTDALLEPGQFGPKDLDRLADTLPAERACIAAALLSRIPDSAETAVRLYRRVLGRRGRGADDSVDGCMTIAAVYALLFRGHVREAARLVGSPRHWLALTVFSDRRRLGMIPPESVRIEFGRLVAARQGRPRAAYDWWASERDTAAIQQHLGHEAGQISRTAGAYQELLRGRLVLGLAYLSIARGDTTNAIRQLLARPDSLQLCWSEARLTLARLLIAEDRIGEAARLLERRWAGTSRCYTPIDDLLWTLLRARAFERAGRREEALAAYRFVASAWRTADAELQPMTREADSAVSRLGAEGISRFPER